MLTLRHTLTTPAAPPHVVGGLLATSGTASAAPEPRMAALPAWQAAALAAYSKEVGMGDLRAELAARVQALTGCAIPGAAIMLDDNARRATTTVDGVVFQLQGSDLRLLRPCAYCGVGRFASPPIASRADLGHALSDWQPYHAGCAPADPADVDW